MFGKKYDPEKIVGQLATILVPSCAPHVTDYINAVQPNEAERTRMMFSMYLFSISASHGLIQTTTNDKFMTALLKAHSIYLERFRDGDMLVNLGEKIVWRIERDSVSRNFVIDLENQLSLPTLIFMKFDMERFSASWRKFEAMHS